MSEKELVEEIMKDYQNAFRFSDSKDAKFRRMVIKANRFPVCAHSFYTSPRKNKWIILFEARTKKEIGDMCRITLSTYFDSPHGVYVAMVTYTNGKSHLIIYPPHFFSRYANRAGVGKYGIDLVVRYLKYNCSYVYSTRETYLTETSIKREVFGSSKEGVALGFESAEGNILFKTFIVYDMLKGEQIEEFTKNEQIRKEIHETEIRTFPALPFRAR